MPCSCGCINCECERVCHCCPYKCLCEKCFEITRRRGASCRPCGGYISPYVCGKIPEWRRTGGFPNYPSLEFLNPSTHQPSSTSDERPNTERSGPENEQGSTTASERSVPEPSHTPPRESSFDDSLIFQMDDIDAPLDEASNTSTGGGNSHERSHFRSDKSSSGHVPLELREAPSRVRRCFNHHPDEAGLKWSVLPRCKMPIWTPLHHFDLYRPKVKEYQGEEMIPTRDIAGCSHNSGRNISENEESRLAATTPLNTLPATDMNRTEMIEREMLTTNQSVPDYLHQNSNVTNSNLNESKSSEQKIEECGLNESRETEIIPTDISGCSHQNTCISKREGYESDNTPSAASRSADKYATDFVPCNFHSGDTPPSTFSVSPRFRTHSLSTSAPFACNLPRPTELKSLEQKASNALETSEASPSSDLSRIDSLRISDSRQTGKSSSSVENLPENMSNGADHNAFHEQPGNASISLASSRLINVLVKTESSQPGTSRTLSASDSLTITSPRMSKADGQASSKSDSSTETISRERTDNYEDPSNESPKKN